MIWAIVGPSGAGKDTLMQAVAAARPDLVLVRRVITRDADAGGEAFDSVDAVAFAARLAAGEFALHWDAHGLRYAIPASVRGDLAAGRIVLFNGSRAMLAGAARVFAGLRALHVTARPEVLAARLAARGRESAMDIAARLARADMALPAGLVVDEIDNSGALDAAVAAVLAVMDRAEHKDRT